MINVDKQYGWNYCKGSEECVVHLDAEDEGEGEGGEAEQHRHQGQQQRHAARALGIALLG